MTDGAAAGAPTAERRADAFGATTFVLVASLAFATSAPLARVARPADPLVIALGRVAIAGALLLAIDFRRSLATVRGMTARQRGIVAAGGVLLAAHFALFLWGLDHTSLPAAVTLVALEPIAVVVCAWAIHAARPTTLERVGLGIATLGAIVVAGGGTAGEHRIVGDAAVLGAVMLFGLYIAAARALRDVLPARRQAALVYAIAALALAASVPLVPAAGPRWPLPTRSLLAIVGIALVPTIVGHTAVQAAARRLSPAVVALSSPGETVGAIAIGAALLGTRPTPTDLVGAIAIVGGSVLVIITSKSERTGGAP